MYSNSLRPRPEFQKLQLRELVLVYDESHTRGPHFGKRAGGLRMGFKIASSPARGLSMIHAKVNSQEFAPGQNLKTSNNFGKSRQNELKFSQEFS